MIVNYKTDFYTSYMLVEIPAEMSRQHYAFKMLEKNKIPGVLSCKERIEDGMAYLYMDISGKKSFVQEYNEKEIELEDMILIFQQLLSVLEELRKYLLTEKMAILEPEYIFRDMEDGSLYITILPWEKEEGNGLHKLAEFFLEKMNHKDEYGVNAAYNFYRQQSQPNFSLYHFIPVLEKENILKRQQRKEILDTRPSIDVTEDNIWKEDDKETESYTENKNQAEEKRKDYTGILLIIFALLILGVSFLPLVKGKQRISCILLAAVLLLFWFLREIVQYKKRKELQETKEKIKEREPLPLVRGMEDTVFFDSDFSEELLKLQWKEKGRTKQYVLRDFPCTVGKIKEEVSVVMENISVSRIHCRFVEKDGGIAIMDLNSTNGTYLNGIPLKEGEILEIVKNDEILIGKVKVLVV